MNRPKPVKPASPPNGTRGLAILPLDAETLLRRMEDALRRDDLPAAEAEARLGRTHFPGHARFASLAAKVEGATTAEEALTQAGWSRPWHLAKVPRKAHFYWGSERTSFLRYLSIASFRMLNPEWEVTLYVPRTVHRGEEGWGTGEAYEGNSYHGPDYAHLLYALPGIRLREVDFSAFPQFAHAMETYKADFFRWHILAKEGGLYSDTDILFTKPMREAPFNDASNAHTQVGCCQHRNLHSIGFLLGAPGAAVYQGIAEAAQAPFDASNYQSIGAVLVNRLYPTVETMVRKHPGLGVLNLPMELVYALDYTRIQDIHGPGDPSMLPAGAIGLHWYAGSAITQRTNNQLTQETCGKLGSLIDGLASQAVDRLGALAGTALRKTLPPATDGPRFSILVPTFNQAHYLPATLDSLLAQTRPDWEAVVINDGSTDGTAEVMAAYAAKDPRIRPFHQPNGGVGAALTRALQEARGTWIGWLSSDDLYEPDALEAFAQGIAEYPQARFFYSNFSQLFEATAEKRPMPTGRQLDLPPFELQTMELMRANFINGISICIQKALLEEVGPWRPELRYAQDHDLWLRISGVARLHYLDRRTCVTRVHAAQGSQGFPMACYYDSARGCLEYLNTHPFEQLFPWMNLQSNTSIGQAIDATAQALASFDAFHYRGVGANTVLADRLGEWLMKRCPDGLRAPLIKGLKEWCHDLKVCPAFLREAVERFGTPATTTFRPQDPLDLMARTLLQMEAGGERQESPQLRRYLEQVVGLAVEAAPPTAPSVAFVHDPDWMDSEWVEILVAYLRTFQPGEPVVLAFQLHPQQAQEMSRDEARELVMELVARERGQGPFPPLQFLDGLPERAALAGMHAACHEIPRKAAVWAFDSEPGRRLAHGRAALRQPRRSAPAGA